MTIETFLATWGYWAVLLGAMVEGESVILTASAAAAAGYLSIYKVAMVAFVGTLFADQGLYIVGLLWGQHALARILRTFPSLSPYVDKGFALLDRYKTAYILTFRFIYGIRTISPVLIGIRGIPVQTFSVLNVVAAILWTVLSCALGYFFGEVIIVLFHKLGLSLLLALVAAAGVSGGLLWRYRRKKPTRPPSISNPGDHP